MAGETEDFNEKKKKKAVSRLACCTVGGRQPAPTDSVNIAQQNYGAVLQRRIWVFNLRS